MSRRSETIDVSAEGDLVRVEYHEIRDSGHDLGGVLWVERPSVSWLADALESGLDVHPFPEVSESRGDDNLRLYESGPEQAPVINIINRRAKEASNGGLCGVNVSVDVARKLLTLLSAHE